VQESVQDGVSKCFEKIERKPTSGIFERVREESV
jgi:hypothetical protein